MRIKIFKLSVVCAFIFMAFMLINLQLIQGRKLRELSNKNRIRLIPQQGARGKILDRYGNVIVDSELSYDVMVSPGDREGLDDTFGAIAKILGISRQELKARFNKGGVSSFSPVTVADNIEIKKAIALEELKTEYNGIVIQPKALRHYPHGTLACHVIGYLNEIDHWRLTKLEDYGYRTKDIVGFGGVEERYDYYLRQEEGGLSQEVNNAGKFVRVLGFRPPKSGKDIQLTLDLKIQKIVEEAMGERRGAVVIMDPYTGEIIAMASRPAFAPQAIIKNSAKYLPAIFQDSGAPMINRAISGSYPAGSVFKITVAAGALENAKINYATTFFCPGHMRIGKRNFACWSTHNQENLNQALIHSCDVFFYHTGLLMGPQLIRDYALKFGLGKPTGIDLPYEVGGLVPDPLWRKIYKFRNWFDGDTANFSIGQGDLLVTPIEVTRAMAVFANKGFLVTPYIVSAVAGQDISSAQRKSIKLPLKENTINYIRRGLKGVIDDPTGTGNVLFIPGLQIAGKTGSAQVARQAAHGWFAGFVPFDKPKFVLCVFLENGGAGYYSCVLAKQILEKMRAEGLI